MSFTVLERTRTYAVVYCPNAGGLLFDLDLADLDVHAFAASEGTVARPACPNCGSFDHEFRLVFPDSYTRDTFGRGRNRMRQAMAKPGPIVVTFPAAEEARS